jgi:hypothetical protein
MSYKKLSVYVGIGVGIGLLIGALLKEIAFPFQRHRDFMMVL